MNRRWLLFGLMCWSARTADIPNRNIEITLERASKDGWHAVNPRVVFVPNDEIRFRFRSTRPGYLYVLNQGSDGSYLWLYPTEATGLENRIESGRDYQIPTNQGAFRIPRNPGYDTVYWIVSEERLRDLPALPEPVPPNPAALIPRCKDELLRARGRCEDELAGPKAIAHPELLPRQLIPPHIAAGDVGIREMQDKSQITIPGSVAFFGYQFVIAHR